MSTPSEVQLTALRADQLERPLGTDNPRPRLSWQLEATARSVRQRAYQVLVATRPELLEPGAADLWDSGTVASSSCIGVEYGGSAPVTRQRCWWTVRVWDQNREASAFAPPSWWEMGLTSAEDWVGQWINVEDEDQRADREAGFVWVEDPLGRLELSYEGMFSLPTAATSGLILVPQGIERVALTVSINGMVVPGRVSEADFEVGEFDYGVPVGPLGAGAHSIRVSVVSKPTTHTEPASPVIAAFLRVSLDDGTTARYGTDGGWLVSSGGGPTIPVQISSRSAQPWPPAPAKHLRHGFATAAPPVRARLYATALGVYSASLNGQRVGDRRLAPEVSQYEKRVYYQTYDVTDLIASGENVLGLTIGDGWYAYTSTDGRFSWAPPPLRVVAQLELTYADGMRQVVGTDSDWRIHDSGLRKSEMKAGEIYDARLEPMGWDRPGFDDSHWDRACIGTQPIVHVVAQPAQPVREIETLSPRSITEARAGVYIIDFGQNFAGVCRLTASGVAGTRIELRYAELLHADGTIDARSMGNPGLNGHSPEIFILRGAPEHETFEAWFTYRGFRYVEVTGLPRPPTSDSVRGVVLHSDLKRTGWFRTSSPLLADLAEAIRWTFKSNYVSIPTDCPSREQHGWLGDASYAWDAGSFLMDTSAFTERYLEAVRDDQFPEGSYPMVAPYPPSTQSKQHAEGGSPSWASAGVLLPWSVWWRYGDPTVIDRNWNAMARFVDSIEANNADFLWRNKRGFDWGDWLAPDDENVYFKRGAVPRTPGFVIASAYWAFNTLMMVEMAEARGRSADALRYSAVYKRIRDAFIDEFVTSDGVVATGSQTSFVLALKLGLVPNELRPVAAAMLVNDVRDHNLALTTGIVGTQFLLDVLADEGYVDVAYDLLLRTEYPSWGHMLVNGATTIWEEWAGDMAYNGGRIPMSQNHPAFGSIGAFLFRRVAGIRAAAPGFEQIDIHPLVDPRVPRNGADYDSVRGRISVDWNNFSDGSFGLDVTLPPNTTSTIHLPTGTQGRLTEDGGDISDSDPEIEVLSRDTDETVVRVGSGTYQFTTN